MSAASSRGPLSAKRPGEFKRTANRHDYATPPHKPTLLDASRRKATRSIGIGKISDIFAGSGITKSLKADGNRAIFDTMIDCVKTVPEQFDHLREFRGFRSVLRPSPRCGRLCRGVGRIRCAHSRTAGGAGSGDLVVFSADHGCDPTWTGTDHTREYIPILAFGPDIAPGPIGKRSDFRRHRPIHRQTSRPRSVCRSGHHSCEHAWKNHRPIFDDVACDRTRCAATRPKPPMTGWCSSTTRPSPRSRRTSRAFSRGEDVPAGEPPVYPYLSVDVAYRRHAAFAKPRLRQGHQPGPLRHDDHRAASVHAPI